MWYTMVWRINSYFWGFFIYIIFQVIYLALENKFLVENNFPNRKLIFLKEFLKILEKFQFSIYMNETLKVLLYQIGNFKFIEENYLEVNVLSDSQLLFFYRKDWGLTKYMVKRVIKTSSHGLWWYILYMIFIHTTSLI